MVKKICPARARRANTPLLINSLSLSLFFSSHVTNMLPIKMYLWSGVLLHLLSGIHNRFF